MSTNNQTSIRKEEANNRLIVEREFNAPVHKSGKPGLIARILDEWWAPKPWKAVTKSMDFREGGTWLYYMLGPDGTKSYCRADYHTIVPNKKYTGEDAFCDEEGNISKEMPVMHWDVNFEETETGTKVTVELTFETETDLEKIVEMGFNEGFTAAHGNLDELLEQKLVVA
jgi:uncharacterized protein YndB with AHSA1/START domain